MFADHLGGEVDPERPLAPLGFLYEEGRELPIGVSKRNYQGLDRVFLNCAVCHVGTVRETADSKPMVITGMPANNLDLWGFQQFLFDAIVDERFTPDRIMAEIEARELEPSHLNRLILRYVGIDLLRSRLLTVRHRFRYLERQDPWGPGRVDTFNSPKALFNFPVEQLPEREWVGTADFPSIWLQGPRKAGEMQLHWDGNNPSTEERNLSAAFGTGTIPPTIDMEAIGRIQDWLIAHSPPAYPFAIDAALAEEGKPIYMRYCADCHGRDGRDFSGRKVGTVEPIEDIGTDPNRLDSYTRELSANQNTLYAGYPWRFTHFRKTYGYANAPLDGIWLRSPYLHNGSVPTLRHLLDRADQRPEVFYRGSDVFDQQRVGYRWDEPTENGRTYFRFDTRLRGNSNAGHEGREYGTELSSREKDAIVEYMKTF